MIRPLNPHAVLAPRGLALSRSLALPGSLALPLGFVLPLGLALALAACQPALAVIETVRFTEVDNGGISDEFLDLAGTRTSDLVIDFTGVLGGQQILIELAAGQMVNHPLADTEGAAPSEALIEISPTVEFDTYLSTAGLASVDAGDWLVFGGAANLLGGLGPVEFSETRLSIAFAPPVGVSIADQTDFPVLRLTLSEDAQGAIAYLGDTSASAPPQVFEFLIVDGEVRSPIDEVLSGDFNTDGRVDNADLNLLLNNWGKTTPEAAWTQSFTAPVNNDELNPLLNDWGGGLAIPEPSAAMVAGMLIAFNRRRPSRRRGAPWQSAHRQPAPIERAPVQRTPVQREQLRPAPTPPAQYQPTPHR